METFAKRFGSLLVFVYHCFDRIVINGYLSNLSRPEQADYFFRQVLGVPVVSKGVLSRSSSKTFIRKTTCLMSQYRLESHLPLRPGTIEVSGPRASGKVH